MKLITPEKDLANLKSRDMALLECMHCERHFETMVKYVKLARQGNPRIQCKFCSQKCSHQHRNRQINTECKNCQKTFAIQNHRILIDGNFCSSSCSALYYNKKKTNKPACKSCANPLKSGKKFCSIKCQHQFTYDSYIEKWRRGEVNGNAGIGHLSPHIRRYMIEKSRHQCSKCHWNTPHPISGKPPLQIDHIDGDWSNNEESNLQVLCPNCHALTENFGSRNKGLGRYKALKEKGYLVR